MSHVSTCESKMDDKVAVKAACKDLGLKVDENVDANLGFNNIIRKADIRITFPDGTQMALVWNKKTKTYEAKSDDYYGKVSKLLGGDLRKLKQGHALKKLEMVARKNGYRVSKGTVDQKTGDVNLYLYE